MSKAVGNAKKTRTDDVGQKLCGFSLDGSRSSASALLPKKLSLFTCLQALCLVILGSVPAVAATVEGRATVVDGDTIGLQGVEKRVRLYGIDAPESGQTCHDAGGRRYLCGSRSADYLAHLIGRNGRLTCREEDRDRYGRIVAECFRPDGMSVNAAMIRAGWAVEYARYSDGRYRAAEEVARRNGAGMWPGEFVRPWEWRRGERLVSETHRRSENRDGVPAGCRIKGNISRNSRIYHSPGQNDYARTRIDASDGERWFCSAA